MNFEVYHRNQQDEQYILYTPEAKLHNVSDEYCFFKSLLNACKIEGDETEQYVALVRYAENVVNLFEKDTGLA